MTRSRLVCVTMPLRFLFVSDSLDRIQHCGFLGRVPAKEHAGEGTDGEGHEDGPRLDIDRPAGNELDGIAGTYAEDDSDNASGDRHHDGFDEELVENVDTSGTHTHA